MFNDAIWEHIDRFTKAKKTSEIQQQLERFSHQMGFDYFRLLIIFPISMQKSHVALFNNCPTSWFDAYSERHYLTQDPVVFLGLKQTQPIFWNKLDCDAVEHVGVGRLDGAHGFLDGGAYVLGCLANIVPVSALGNLEAVVLGKLGIGEVALRVSQGSLVFLFPHVRYALVEQQWEDELLVVTRVNEAAQQHGGTPQVAFEFLLADAFTWVTHFSHPPSVMTCASRSSASRQRMSASLNAAMASGSGGMSSCNGGRT